MGNKHSLQMQRRNIPIIEPKPTKVIQDDGRAKVNQYTCDTCGQTITTIDRDYGTTPFRLYCRVTDDCDGNMCSHHYMVDQTLTPDYEWYKPTKAKGANREHVKLGGLLIRKIQP